MAVPRPKNWIQWSCNLLSKLKKYQKLNKHLAIENRLLLSQIQQQPTSGPSLAALILQSPTGPLTPIISYPDPVCSENNCHQPSESLSILCNSNPSNNIYSNNLQSIQPLSAPYETVGDYDDGFMDYIDYDASLDNDITSPRNLSALFDHYSTYCAPPICSDLFGHEEPPPPTQEENTDAKMMVIATAATDDDHDTCTILNDDPVASTDSKEEEEVPPILLKRKRHVDSYALPSLKSKLRKGDRFSFTTPATTAEAIGRKRNYCPISPPPPPPPPLTPPLPLPAKRKRHVDSYALPSLKSKLRKGDRFSFTIPATTAEAIARKRNYCPLSPPPPPPSPPPPPTPPLPAKRKRRVDSYALPSLKSKLRKGDRFSFRF
ncbi:hypothetical protein BCR42DRAFT_453750 [Absidia repens]|uniref:Shugoshin C-terminal domain-containing protein n=1 Tax=Absidia repens TaxID=90262 RepID=A0A1X2IA20_9FUNG|nr:hypothetical protein BCR42DRAFT_453750 [Absidia repens]